MVLWRRLSSDQPVDSILREAFFNVISVFSGAGFASGSFDNWGTPVVIVTIAVGMIGGCTSSSSAALSVFQVQIALRAIAAEIRRIHSPHRMTHVMYDGRRVDDDALNCVIMYVYSFVFVMGALAVVLTLLGLDLESAVFASWASITNVGYGLGPIAARTGTFVEFPDAAKWAMMLGMVIGRLALMTFFVILLPRFWLD